MLTADTLHTVGLHYSQWKHVPELLPPSPLTQGSSPSGSDILVVAVRPFDDPSLVDEHLAEATDWVSLCPKHDLQRICHKGLVPKITAPVLASEISWNEPTAGAGLARDNEAQAGYFVAKSVLAASVFCL